MEYMVKLGLVRMLMALPLVALLIGLNLRRSDRKDLRPLTVSASVCILPLVYFVLQTFTYVLFRYELGPHMVSTALVSPLIFLGGLILAVVFWAGSVGRTECRWGLVTVLLEAAYLVLAIVFVSRIRM
mgnify:CR=1 FL=1